MKVLAKLIPRDHWTKLDYMKACYGEDMSGVDPAIPQAVADRLTQLGLNIRLFVFSYKEEDGKPSFGALVHLPEKLVAKMQKLRDKEDKLRLEAKLKRATEEVGCNNPHCSCDKV